MTDSNIWNHIDATSMEVAIFLRTTTKCVEGKFQSRRVPVFKGSNAVKRLLSARYKNLRVKNPLLPEINDEAAAVDILDQLLFDGVFVRTKQTTGKNLKIDDNTHWENSGLYVWILEHKTYKDMIKSISALLFTMWMICFPMWPRWVKRGIGYTSLYSTKFLAWLFYFIFFRFGLYLVMKLAKRRPIWIFPNLFADVSVRDSFIPVWDYHKEGESMLGDLKKDIMMALRKAHGEQRKGRK